MGMTLALGCYTNDPIRVPVALHGLKPLLVLPDDVNGYGLATCVDGHVVQKRVPLWPKKNKIETLMNNKRAAFQYFKYAENQIYRQMERAPIKWARTNSDGTQRLSAVVPSTGTRQWRNEKCCTASCLIS